MQHGNEINGPLIQLKSGYYLSLEDPNYANVEITDIAHALSNLCRFTGHTRHFYSVAEHSVLGSFHVPPEYALEFLLHDAHEFAIGDVSSPLKMLLPEYKKIEAVHESRVRARFGFTSPRMSDLVKRADLSMLAAERMQLLPSVGQWGILEGVEPFNTAVFGWDPEEAFKRFVRRFYDLSTLYV